MFRDAKSLIMLGTSGHARVLGKYEDSQSRFYLILLGRSERGPGCNNSILQNRFPGEYHDAALSNLIR